MQLHIEKGSDNNGEDGKDYCVLRRYYFLDEEHRDAEYQAAMEELCMFVTIGKNEHDDAADGLTQLEMFIEGGKPMPTRIIKSPI